MQILSNIVRGLNRSILARHFLSCKGQEILADIETLWGAHNGNQPFQAADKNIISFLHNIGKFCSMGGN